eukprot:CAMPEP_0194204350 /NCGR_PEP_ID=MMETSP0156-20130528/3904_1 /TAXON_ID=33649 /ORGANISM="Thalassionema nitzschioides, Strain L26-B" /LENGTH=690 /DNA_ID=CAMNT_0038930345 /DNA_START=117 /DNA_END=2192 /DNA_ORIENTATION=-
MVLEQLPSISEDESSLHGLGRFESTSWDDDTDDEDYSAEARRRKKRKKKKRLRDLEKAKNEPEVDPLAELMNDGSISVSSVEGDDDNDGSIDLNDVDFEELEALATGTTTAASKRRNKGANPVGTAAPGSSLGMQPQSTATESAGILKKSKRMPPKRLSSPQKPVETNGTHRRQSNRLDSNADSDTSEEFDVDSEIQKNQGFDGPDAWKPSDTFIPVIHDVESPPPPVSSKKPPSRRQRRSRMDPREEQVDVKRIVLKKKKKRSDSSWSSSQGSSRESSSSQNASQMTPSQKSQKGKLQISSSYEITPKVEQKRGKSSQGSPRQSSSYQNPSHTTPSQNAQTGQPKKAFSYDITPKVVRKSSQASSQGAPRQSSSYQNPSQNAGQPKKSSSYDITPRVVRSTRRGRELSRASGKERQGSVTSTEMRSGNGNHVEKVLQGTALVIAGQQYSTPQESRREGSMTRIGRKTEVKEVAIEEKEEKGCNRGAICGCVLLGLCAIGVALFLFVYVFRDDKSDSPSTEEMAITNPPSLINFPTPSPSMVFDPEGENSASSADLVSASPTAKPTNFPSTVTSSPSLRKSFTPTAMATAFPTAKPSSFPTISSTFMPSTAPTIKSSSNPTISPTFFPSATPTTKPSALPTGKPTLLPSIFPTSGPSLSPSALKTPAPTFLFQTLVTVSPIAPAPPGTSP